MIIPYIMENKKSSKPPTSYDVCVLPWPLFHVAKHFKRHGASSQFNLATPIHKGIPEDPKKVQVK